MQTNNCQLWHHTFPRQLESNVQGCITQITKKSYGRKLGSEMAVAVAVAVPRYCHVLGCERVQTCTPAASVWLLCSQTAPCSNSVWLDTAKESSWVHSQWNKKPRAHLHQTRRLEMWKGELVNAEKQLYMNCSPHWNLCSYLTCTFICLKDRNGKSSAKTRRASLPLESPKCISP